ncbi:alpha-ketoglutarate-dependent dioxygenase AlkB family protein, partial [Acinetobacter sp.]
MNLPDQNDAPPNLLPYDGMVQYYGPILNSKAADEFFQLLMRRIAWQHDEAVIFGKRIATKRKVAWYGNLPYYTYSKTTKHALLWTEELLQLRHWVERRTGETFNSCLLNLYHDGSEGMAWHSDGEKDLKLNGAIASLSLG